jgi:hypothetical protein
MNDEEKQNSEVRIQEPEGKRRESVNVVLSLILLTPGF